MNEKTNDLYLKLTKDTASLNKEERKKFVQNSLCFLLAVMRGAEGKEFTDGFIQASNEDDIKLILEKEHE